MDSLQREGHIWTASGRNRHQKQEEVKKLLPALMLKWKVIAVYVQTGGLPESEDMDGISSLERILKKVEKLPVIVLTKRGIGYIINIAD